MSCYIYLVRALAWLRWSTAVAPLLLHIEYNDGGAQLTFKSSGVVRFSTYMYVENMPTRLRFRYRVTFCGAHTMRKSKGSCMSRGQGKCEMVKILREM